MPGGVKEYQGLSRVCFVSETAQVELRSGRVEAPDGLAPTVSSALVASSSVTAAVQGLTLVHFSAQFEPCLTHTKYPTHPKHPLNTGYTTPTHTPYPIPSAQVELKRGRV